MTFFFVGGAASQAGIKGGDHILEINGLNVRCSKSFICELSHTVLACTYHILNHRYHIQTVHIQTVHIQTVHIQTVIITLLNLHRRIMLLFLLINLVKNIDGQSKFRFFLLKLLP